MVGGCTWRHNNVGGVTAGQAPYNSSNVGVVTAGQVGHTTPVGTKALLLLKITLRTLGQMLCVC